MSDRFEISTPKDVTDLITHLGGTAAATDKHPITVSFPSRTLCDNFVDVLKSLKTFEADFRHNSPCSGRLESTIFNFG